MSQSWECQRYTKIHSTGFLKTSILRTLQVVWLAATISLATHVHAEVVLANLDYNSNFSGTDHSGAAAVGNAGDFWNTSPTFFNFVGTETPSGNTGGTAPFGAVELLDTAGGGSGISYQMTFTHDTFGFNGAFEDLAAVPATTAANLLGDYVFVGGADGGEALNFELSGLATGTEYSLYLYGNGNALGQGAVWTLGGTSQTTVFDGTSTLDSGGEYTKFTFNTGLSTTQSFTATHLTGGIAVNGFQLTTATAVPEPASFALMTFAGLAGFAQRRRRKRSEPSQ